jgi:hypothetical protein
MSLLASYTNSTEPSSEPLAERLCPLARVLANTQVFRALLLQLTNRRREHDVGDGNRCSIRRRGARCDQQSKLQRCGVDGFTGLSVTR